MKKTINPVALTFWSATAVFIVGNVQTALADLAVERTAIESMVARLDLFIQSLMPW